MNVAGGSDGRPNRARIFQTDNRLQSLPDVLGGESGPDHVGKLSGAVVEDVYSQAVVVGAGQERVSGPEARADDAELFVALLLKPVETRADVYHRLARGVNGPRNIRGDGVI